MEHDVEQERPPDPAMLQSTARAGDACTSCLCNPHYHCNISTLDRSDWIARSFGSGCGVVEIVGHCITGQRAFRGPMGDRAAVGACLGCTRRKRRCERRARDGGACRRCKKNGVPCEPVPPGGPSRRERERQQRQERLRDGGGSEDDDGGEGTGSGSRGGSSGALSSGGAATTGRAPGSAGGSDAAPPAISQSYGQYSTIGHPDSGQAGGMPGLPAWQPVRAVGRPVLAGPVAPMIGGSELLFAAIDTFWQTCNVTRPFVHRFTFEGAFLGASAASSVYGKHRPMALLFAMAAFGAIALDSPGFDRQMKLAASKAFALRARDILLAGFFGRDGSRTVTELEAAQATLLLHIILVVELEPDSSRGLFERSLSLVVSLYRGLLDSGAAAAPPNHESWIRTEMIIRLLIIATGTDAGLALFSKRHRYVPDSAFGGRLLLPAHDTLFLLPSETALHVLQRARAHETQPDVADLAASIDMANVKLARTSPESARQMVRECVAPIFDGRGSLLGTHFLALYVFDARKRMHTFAKTREIDPRTVAFQPPELDSPNEAEYRLRASAVEALADELPRALPAELSAAMAAGDPAPLLAAADMYFPDRTHALSFLDSYAVVLGLCIGSHLISPPGAPTPPLTQREASFLCSNPAFLSTVSLASSTARLMHAMRRADPQLRVSAETVVLTATFVAGVQIAAARVFAAAGVPAAAGWAGEALRTADWMVAYEATRFRNAAQTFAPQFKLAVQAALAAVPPPMHVHAAVSEGLGSGAMGDAVFAGERALADMLSVTMEASPAG
ncbi:hypothetical protein DFJ74DRAFT_312946 [Hyaloraphidium curvatum]|nr:hypothetical protein DFJ74DRAFT_312946 [Hyaloraphidium curvatum]